MTSKIQLKKHTVHDFSVEYFERPNEPGLRPLDVSNALILKFGSMSHDDIRNGYGSVLTMEYFEDKDRWEITKNSFHQSFKGRKLINQ